MPRGKKRGQQPAAAEPAGPDDVLAEAETLLERGERQLRFKEHPKAQRFFEAAVQTVYGAGLAGDPDGCLLVASATDSLLEIDREAARLHEWATKPAAAPAAAAAAAPAARTPLNPEQRLTALRAADEALVQGLEGLTPGAAYERSNICDARAQVQTLISEEMEAAAERAPAQAGAEVEAAARSAAALAEALWEEAGQQHLLGQRDEEWEPEPDVDLLTALARACVRKGALLLRGEGGSVGVRGAKAEGRAAVKRALGLFEEAVSRCDSAKGDSVDSVLKDWAQTLWDAADLVPPAAAAECLSRAANKASDAMSMQSVPTVELCLLLGDLLVAKADFTREAGDAAAAASLYSRAVDEGFGRALRVRASEIRAKIGAADAHLAVARLELAQQAAGGGAPAAGALPKALALYQSLLASPRDEWVSQGLQVHEWGEARYNACCALALAGREAECAALLRALLAEGDVNAVEVARDADFAHVLGTEWARALLGHTE